MQHWIPRLLLFFFALPSAWAGGGGRKEGIPHESLAQELLGESGLTGREPESLVVDDLLAGAYLRADLGLFELHARRKSLADADNAKSLQSVAEALIQAQAILIDWVAAEDQGETAAADLEIVRKWVSGWKPGKLADAARAKPVSLADALEVPAPTKAAIERFGNFMRRGGPLGLAREEVRSEGIVLCPSRREFITFLSACGWLRPDFREAFWKDEIVQWNYCYADRLKVIPQEYAAIGRADNDWEAGTSMNSRSPTGMEQQVVQLATNSMLDNYFGDRIPPSLAGALSINLVIELFGQCDTRIDGDLRERRTQARELFVPGGMSEGGLLAPNFADSRWRTGGGADHFIRALTGAQESGAKEGNARNEKHRWFLLFDEANAARECVHAPFLGSSASEKPLQDQRLEGDFLDFLRSYRVCFVWWLQSKSETPAKKSKADFATFLRTLASQPDADLQESLQKLYGQPLSSVDASKEDLEGRFLLWLGKQ